MSVITIYVISVWIIVMIVSISVSSSILNRYDMKTRETWMPVMILLSIVWPFTIMLLLSFLIMIYIPTIIIEKLSKLLIKK